MELRWTEDQYMEWLENRGQQTARQKPKKRSKYNAKKTWIDGVCFDSKKEGEYYNDLKLLQQAGAIKGFCRQPEFILVEGSAEDRAITYKADFIVFHNDGRAEIVDVKGYESQQWKRTFKQFRLKYPELELKIVKEV
jgi:hypothetical protein